MIVGRGGFFCAESSPSDQCKARGVVASMMASLSVASIGVLAINGNLLMLLNNPRILQPMSKGVCLHRWRNSHIMIIILSEIDRYMLLWTWLHEPGSRASQLVPFEKHDRQNSSSEDVIGFLVKHRCIRSRRFVWRLGRSIFNLPVVSLFVANLLTRETLALVEGTYEIASRQQQAKNTRYFGKRPTIDQFGFASAREKPRVAGLSKLLLAADLTLASGPAASPVVQRCL